VDRRVGEDCST